MLIEAAGAASSVLLYSQLGFRRQSGSPGGHRTTTPLLSPSPNPHRSWLPFVAGAADSTQPAASSSVAASSQKAIIVDNDFSLEKVTEDGKYCLVLVFEAKALELSEFVKRQVKFTSFFGPGITAEVGNGENPDLYEVRLISETSTQSS